MTDTKNTQLIDGLEHFTNKPNGNMMKPLKNSTVERLYNVFSKIPFFWEIDAWTCRATDNSPYRAGLIDALNISKGSSVLDVACGTGLNFSLLQRTINSQGSIVGIDNSDKTLNLARKLIKKHEWKNVVLKKSDSSKYESDGEYDAAICTFAIEIIPPYRETINTMIKAVKPGGRIGFIGFKLSNNPFFNLFNAPFKWMSVPFGGVDLKRNIPEYLRKNTNEVVYKEVFGGFYYIAVCEKS